MLLALISLLLISDGADGGPQRAASIKAVSVQHSFFSNEEESLLLRYQEKSNKVRNVLTDIYKAPPSQERQRHIDAQTKIINDVDAEVIGFVERAVGEGYWKHQTARNPKLDQSVWLAIQHSGSPSAEKRTLEDALHLVGSGMLSGEKYALLFDRVALREGRKQRYGTQLNLCTDGKFVVGNLEDPLHVDEFRKQMGIVISVREYEETFKSLTCTS
jgi:hypothetical protein